MNLSSFLKYAAGASLAAALLAGCSAGTSQLTPAVAPAQPSGAAPDFVKVNPDREIDYKCKNAIYGNYWIYETEPPPAVSLEYTGLFYMNSAGVAVPCGDDKYDGSLTYNVTNWTWSGAFTYNWGGYCAECITAVNNISSTIGVVKVSVKSQKTVATISTCKSCLITGLAKASDNTGFAAVTPSSGSGNSEVLVYAPGATSPTSELQVPSGMVGVGVAVDAAKNVYWTANATVQSTVTGELYEFPYESSGTYGSPVLLASTSKIGGIMIASSGGTQYIAYSLPSAGTIELANLASSGNVTTIKPGGSPEALTLDKTGKMMTATDPVNNKVSTYAFPSGTLMYSTSLEVKVKSGATIVPTSMARI